MKRINGKIRLVDLARRLGCTSANLKYHIYNDNVLGEDAEKLGEGQTDDILLSIDSILKFIEWAFSNSRRLDYNKLVELKEELST